MEAIAEHDSLLFGLSGTVSLTEKKYLMLRQIIIKIYLTDRNKLRIQPDAGSD